MENKTTGWSPAVLNLSRDLTPPVTNILQNLVVETVPSVVSAAIDKYLQKKQVGDLVRFQKTKSKMEEQAVLRKVGYDRS